MKQRIKLLIGVVGVVVISVVSTRLDESLMKRTLTAALCLPAQAVALGIRG